MSNLEAPKSVWHTLAGNLVHDAAEYGVRFLDTGKVYLGSIPSLDLTDPEWVATLDELRTRGLVQFARCDYTAAADHELLAQSVYSPPGTGATFHFLCVA